MSIPKSTKVYIVNESPTGAITPSTFRLETQPLPSESELKGGQLLVRTIAMSNDPAQRLWITKGNDPRRLYVDPVNQGDPMKAYLMTEVMASKSEQYPKGSTVLFWGGWSEYSVVNENAIRSEAVMIKGQSEYLSMGLLGLSGLTAYSAVYGECDLKKDQVVVVSGAAGGVGSVFVQIAKKVVGCKTVIGIAGGKEKCDWVKTLGADDCFDYKDPDFAKHLTAALPDYADLYFDNVGGVILNTMLGLVKRFGKVVVCGAVSGYHGKALELSNWNEVIYNRITIKGFIYFDNTEVLKEAVSDMTKWIEEGKIDVTESETVVDTVFEDIPKTWGRLFVGENRGKLITKLVPNQGQPNL